MTPEIKLEIETLRSRIARGEVVPLEDMARAVALYRGARGAVSTNIEKKKKEPKPPKVPKAPKPTGDDLLDDFLKE